MPQSTLVHPEHVPKSPSVPRNTAFFSTGILAGAASLPVEGAFLSFQTRRPDFTAGHKHIRSSALHVLPRTGIRFYTFDEIRFYSSQYLKLPTTLCGALGGAAGGFNEVVIDSLVSKYRLPPIHASSTQAGKLFLCFGTYTFLSTNLSDELPPRPFWRCWLMGAAAGGFGSAITAAVVEGARGRALHTAALRGALVIGTVISVQVTSCAATLRAFDID